MREKIAWQALVYEKARTVEEAYKYPENVIVDSLAPVAQQTCQPPGNLHEAPLRPKTKK
jgi:hypothetical protein